MWLRVVHHLRRLQKPAKHIRRSTSVEDQDKYCLKDKHKQQETMLFHTGEEHSFFSPCSRIRAVRSCTAFHGLPFHVLGYIAVQTFSSSSSSFSSNFPRRQRAPLAGLHQDAESQTSPSRCELRKERAARGQPAKSPGAAARARRGTGAAPALPRPPSGETTAPRMHGGAGRAPEGRAAARCAGRCSPLPPFLSYRWCCWAAPRLVSSVYTRQLSPF